LSPLGFSGILHSSSPYQTVYLSQSYILTQVIALIVLSGFHAIILNKVSIHAGPSTIYFTNGQGNHHRESIKYPVSSTITGLPNISNTSFAFLLTISIISIDWISFKSHQQASLIFSKSSFVYHLSSIHNILLDSCNLCGFVVQKVNSLILLN
jgi:hypothetical protein